MSRIYGTAKEYNKVTVLDEWALLDGKTMFRRKVGNLDWTPWAEISTAWPFAEHVASLIETKYVSE